MKESGVDWGMMDLSTFKSCVDDLKRDFLAKSRKLRSEIMVNLPCALTFRNDCMLDNQMS